MSVIFGPVYSRRLGMSLGFELVPYKVCSMNCIYCEVGHTTLLTIERAGYIPFSELKKGLEVAKNLENEFDVLTFTGSGEPTLNIYFEKLVEEAKKLFKKPIAVLTNSSLVWIPSVRNALAKVDFVLASLDAVKISTFKKVNRPHFKLNLFKIIEGLKMLRETMKGKLFLEVLLVKGVNDKEEDLEELKKVVNYIKPHKVQLNTVVRPPAEEVEPVSEEFLKKLAKNFDVEAEVIGFSSYKKKEKALRDLKEVSELIVEYVKRRPSSKEELCKAFGFTKDELAEILETLIAQRKIKEVYYQDEVYYEGEKGVL